jgi:hypothetical protein
MADKSSIMQALVAASFASSAAGFSSLASSIESAPQRLEQE